MLVFPKVVPEFVNERRGFAVSLGNLVFVDTCRGRALRFFPNPLSNGFNVGVSKLIFPS